MKPSLTALAASLLLGGAGLAQAAITEEQARQLGSSLTAIGAEKDGNADGSIPAYAGGLTTPPPGFKAGAIKRPDPFAGEKPVLSVNSANAGQYEAQLTEGSKALLKRFPGSFRIDVYPTHRTVAFPPRILDNTRKCATTARLSNNGNSLEGARACLPFPIPKDGQEAIWNHKMRYPGLNLRLSYEAYNVDASGRATLSSAANYDTSYPYHDPKASNPKLYELIGIEYTAPARRAGEKLLVHEPIDDVNVGRRAWQYLPGQRRVRLAPDIAYDTPNPTTAGASTYDDAFIFNGAIDRYDWKLLGKKEMFVPYNTYRFTYFATPAEALKPGHINPDVLRWEKHRVWVVQATLKPGKRHIYSKRTFYLDEDSWMALASEEYDARGQLYRLGYAFMVPNYDQGGAPFTDSYMHYDLIARLYALATWPACARCGVKFVDKFPSSTFTPDGLAGSGVR